MLSTLLLSVSGGLLAWRVQSRPSRPPLITLLAPPALPVCVAWAVIPRSRVLRDYTVELLHALAPQLDRHDLRRVLEGNQAAAWPVPPDWTLLTQTITN